MGRKARSTLAQSGRLESQKISGGGRSVFLDFSFYRTSRDLAELSPGIPCFAGLFDASELGISFRPLLRRGGAPPVEGTEGPSVSATASRKDSSLPMGLGFHIF